MNEANRVVVALGGNAFARGGARLSMEGQFRFAHEALRQLSPLLGEEHRIVLCHGNGPQVGHMLIRVERSLGAAYAIPLEVCVAESEGELGYVLLQSLHNVLAEVGVRRPVASLLTQVVVDAADPAFANPTKPIGPGYEAEQAAELRARGFALVEDPDRGWRRVVPSPEPLEIVDLDVLAQLFERGVLVIAAGGGGIPVVREANKLEGVDAVVDKDLTAALLADRVGAELLVILTGVPCAYRNYGSERQAPLGRLSPARVGELLAEGHFPPGSMGPKMEAARRFVRRDGRRAIVCDPDALSAALRGEAGTRIEWKGDQP
ncbi:MAG: carbamate kinase [Deltaproteobacteria bacterium]|nr:carbamate kinase [Deltaproteobacteria bacterium]